jgi:hypothetical protein
MRPLAVLAIVVTVLSGVALILIAATFGSCSAFGGRCPAEQPSLIDDDTFGLAATGAFLIVVVPTFLSRPSWGRLGFGLVAGLCAGLLVGVVVRAVAHG